ncbi:MAG: hypothetical protein IPP03_14990 [Dechloromonas sp.]|nr:hypothetical protein [Candidatus Dechloromonas phosphoritropha]MBP8789007.1 hypothetical protein [Azonexus sp.]MBP9227333.1 hypothetical protein [Azonexus sp.]
MTKQLIALALAAAFGIAHAADVKPAAEVKPAATPATVVKTEAPKPEAKAPEAKPAVAAPEVQAPTNGGKHGHAKKAAPKTPATHATEVPKAEADKGAEPMKK